MAKRYYKHKIEKLIVVEDIVTIHYLQPEKNFSFPEEKHDFWEIVYADKGPCIARAEGKDIPLSEGEMLFHKPDIGHALKADGKKAPSIFIITFVCKSRAMRFFEDKKIKLSKTLSKFVYYITEEGKNTFNLPYFNPNLTHMELKDRPALGGQQLIKNYLEILLINIMRAETERDCNEVFVLKEAEGKVTGDIIALLRASIGEKLSVSEICARVNYNKSYVFSRFKADTGVTVMTYFTNLKIERAKQLLREGNLNVSQISAELAFDTPNYFTKTFKKITGYSPLQYKKLYLSAPS